MYITNHDIHYLKALSVWFHSFNFLSWPAIGSASGLKTVGGCCDKNAMRTAKQPSRPI